MVLLPTFKSENIATVGATDVMAIRDKALFLCLKLTQSMIELNKSGIHWFPFLSEDVFDCEYSSECLSLFTSSDYELFDYEVIVLFQPVCLQCGRQMGKVTEPSSLSQLAYNFLSLLLNASSSIYCDWKLVKIKNAHRYLANQPTFLLHSYHCYYSLLNMNKLKTSTARKLKENL